MDRTNTLSLTPGAALLVLPLAALAGLELSSGMVFGIHPLLMHAKLLTLAGLGGAFVLVTLAARRLPRFASLAAEGQRIVLTIATGVTLCFAGLVALGAAALDGQLDGHAPGWLSSGAALPALGCIGAGILGARLLLGRPEGRAALLRPFGAK